MDGTGDRDAPTDGGGVAVPQGPERAGDCPGGCCHRPRHHQACLAALRGLLAGGIDELPQLDVLGACIDKRLPAKAALQQASARLDRERGLLVKAALVSGRDR